MSIIVKYFLTRPLELCLIKQQRKSNPFKAVVKGGISDLRTFGCDQRELTGARGRALSV